MEVLQIFKQKFQIKFLINFYDKVVGMIATVVRKS
jgi:hypothetical protein